MSWREDISKRKGQLYSPSSWSSVEVLLQLEDIYSVYTFYT